MRRWMVLSVILSFTLLAAACSDEGSNADQDLSLQDQVIEELHEVLDAEDAVDAPADGDTGDQALELDTHELEPDEVEVVPDIEDEHDGVDVEQGEDLALDAHEMDGADELDQVADFDGGDLVYEPVVSCEGRRCVASFTADHSVQIIDAEAGLVLFRDHTSIKLATPLGIASLAIESPLDGSLFEGGMWLLYEDRVEQCTVAGDVVASLSLPSEEPRYVWGTNAELWLSGDDGLWMREGDEWTLVADRYSERVRRVGPNHVAEAGYGYFHLWDTRDMSETELGGSDDYFNWFMPCEADAFWAGSMTGLSLYCTVAEGCVFPGASAYVQNRDGVCENGRISRMNWDFVNEQAILEWMDGAGDLLPEEIPGLYLITGDMETTWLFVEPI